MANFLEFISRGLHQIQRTFFPDLEHEAGPIPESLVKLTYLLEAVHSQKMPLPEQCWIGRPSKSRRGIFNAFVAKAYLKMPTTLHLVERLQSDHHLRLICGFETRSSVPSESVFSRVFAEFAKTKLPQHVHEAFTKNCCAGKISGHISRDSTAIEAREKPERKEQSIEPPAKKRKGRPRKGEPPKIKEASRVQKQMHMTLEEMLKELPTACNRGSKKNSQGFVETWIGYKLHIDTADDGIPISAILSRQHERCRECNACRQLFYPKLAPVVMVLIKKDDKILLARSPNFPGQSYSVLAGFVDPGETLEQCVIREVYEEVGMQVKNIKYFQSQPWPFSHSLIIGFTCEWLDGEIRIDPQEIEAANWFDLSNMPELPPKLSLARTLIASHMQLQQY